MATTPDSSGGNGRPGCACDAHELSPQDQRNFETLNGKLQLVRDYTASVATGRTTGFYLYGPGGCGKSYAVLEELARREVPYRLFNSRMTGRAFYNALYAFQSELARSRYGAEQSICVRFSIGKWCITTSVFAKDHAGMMGELGVHGGMRATSDWNAYNKP
jgi:hypothetical protein